MKKFEKILLASDIDGTYIWKNSPAIPRNAERVRYFVENGGKFAFSSGRSHWDFCLVIPEARELCSMPCVLCNGAYCYDTKTGEIANPHFLDEKYAAEMLRFISGMCGDDVGWRVSDENGFVIRESDEYIQNNMKSASEAIYALARKFPDEEIDGKRYFKAVIISRNAEKLGRIFEAVQEKYPDFSFTRSSDTIAEVLPVGVSKAVQLKYLKERYEKTLGSVKLFCVGDYDNDIDMLKFADVGMCPANATEQVKSICKVRLCHCSEGAVAHAVDIIEDYIDGKIVL